MDKILIVVPVYNVEKYLSRCLDSILSQTYTLFDCLCIDDGSTDNSGKILDEYVIKDKRIIVIHQSNQGVSAARNYGVSYAQTNNYKYLAFVDSDDVVSPLYLKMLYDTLVSNDADISIGRHEFLYEGNNSSFNLTLETKSFVVERENIEDFWCKHAYSSCWNKLFKVDLFEGVLFPIGEVYEDESTIYKLIFKCNRLVKFDKIIYNYLIGHNGIMYGCMTPKKKAMQLNSVSSQLDFYYANGYMKCFNCFFAKYVNILQYAVIQYYTDKSYVSFFENEKVKINSMPQKFLTFYEKEDLKFKYYKIFKSNRTERLALLREDVRSVKKERGVLFAFLYYTKHILPNMFMINNKKIVSKKYSTI